MITENTYKRKSQNYFDTSAAGYDHTSDMGIRPPLLAGLLAQLTKLPGPNSILDVGCGTGELLFQLQARTQATLAGLDISAKMLDVAHQKLGESADLRQGDSETLPWSANRFDLVCCTLSFHHYPNPRQALAEMRRVLKPGGALLLADITMPTPTRQLANLILPLLSTGDRHFYSQAEMFSLLAQAGFKTPVWHKIDGSTFLVSACVP
jgi:ubiquinone/menaquinone biosynthesis C-methylase UbiE